MKKYIAYFFAVIIDLVLLFALANSGTVLATLIAFAVIASAYVIISLRVCDRTLGFHIMHHLGYTK